MKRFASVFLIMVVILCFSACINKSQTSQNETEAKESTTSVTVNEPPLTEKDIGGGYIESSKYRQCYYHVPVYFIELVGEDEYNNWNNEIYEFNQDEIKIGSFVRYFNISKEVFEKTNLQMAKDFVEWGEKPTLRPLDYENQQTYEIYNADIIYTFDDNIINEYYLTPDYSYCADFEYEAAVKRGEYTSQTEKWVDVEALEAEIIAKYGEAEIVTETTEDVTAESTVEASEAETEITTEIPYETQNNVTE